MAFYRQWALGCVGACALAFAGCQEDNEGAMKAQANLPPPADAKGAPAQPQPRTMEDMVKQHQSNPAATYGSNYPGAAKVKDAAPAEKTEK